MTRRLAYHHTPGTGPTIVFLPGYASDMAGTKALTLEAWAKRQGRGFLRFDYAGCGQSEGEFAQQTLAGWLGDVLAMLDQVASGPVVLVGSSMGGWLMLLAAKARPERVRALVGIAPAPDFTDWGFTTEEKMTLLQDGRLERPNPYGPEPTLYTRGFWSSGEANRLMFGPIAFAGPVRLLQGQADTDVPWHRTARLAELIASSDVRTLLVKDGDHRLSREADISLLIDLVDDALAAVETAAAPDVGGMKYLHTMIRVADPDKTIAFFELLGLKEVRRMEDAKGRYTLIFLATPDDMNAPGERANAEVELTYNWPAEDGSAPEDYGSGRNFGHLAYRVDDIYATCERMMAAGVTINRPPRDGHMAFVKSPDGISIELLQDGTLAPAEPWASMPNTGSW